MEGREPVKSGTLEEYKKDPEFAEKESELAPKGLTIFPQEWQYKGYAWGMAIDLTSCVGCNACVVACQSENNIAVVGKEQVLNTREMHWIRIDRYYSGTPIIPRLTSSRCLHAVRKRAVRTGLPGCRHRTRCRRPQQHGLQPLHRHALLLEQLPLQGAAVQLPLFTDWETESYKLQRNPDVTVRSRGVMEKCTYCMQRINYAKITRRSRTARSRTAKSSPPAPPPAPRRRSCSAISTIPRAKFPSESGERPITHCWAN